MKAPKQKGHSWLKDVLGDQDYMQKDVAKAWGCTDAVVSRFLKTGAPELTWDRALSLSRMLGIPLDELRLRLGERLPMQRGVKSKPPPKHEPEVAAQKDCDALDNLKRAVDRARRELPDVEIKVSIIRRESEDL